MIPPVLKDEALVPPLAIGNIPVISDVKLMEVADKAPFVDRTIPVPKDENTGAEVTVNDPPIPTLPDAFKLENWEFPDTFNPDKAP